MTASGDDAASEPEPGVATAETHISRLFFAGDRAFKLLKPITTPFLDYGPVEARLAAADREIELNRRLAPDVYLGHADVVEDGRVVDRMIVMRRLPADRQLTRLLGDHRSRGDAGTVAEAVRSVARAVAAFHASLAPLDDGREVADIAGCDAVRGNWSDNVEDLSGHLGTVVDPDVHHRIVGLVDRYLDHHHDLFRRRIAEGHVREGHGDLTAEDIYLLDDGPRIIDCLAFSRRLRVSDVLADIGFLAMDLDRLAGPDLARRLMRWYGEYADEHHPPSLAHHYVAYRAHVRAKVEALRHAQGDADAGPRVASYLGLALDHLERAQLKVVLVGGAPGTGKSTLADALSRELGFVVLDSDPLRKDLAGRAHTDRDDADLADGSHTPAFDDATYGALHDRAGSLLARGESVILDASWASGARRSRVRELARREGAVCLELECDAPSDQARDRVIRRLETGRDASDARPELLDDLRTSRDPWPQAHRITTSGPLERSVAAALTAIDRHRSDPSDS